MENRITYNIINYKSRMQSDQANVQRRSDKYRLSKVQDVVEEDNGHYVRVDWLCASSSWTGTPTTWRLPRGREVGLAAFRSGNGVAHMKLGWAHET